MSARLIDGKARAAALRAEVAAGVAAFRAQAGRAPGLAVVLVGADPASQVYVRNKGRATREAGMESFEHRLPADASQATLVALIDRLNADPAVDGILVQLPAPPQIDEGAVITRIHPDKDVDGLNPVNAGRLALGATGATAIFGGFTPWIAELLVQRTGSTLAPGVMIAVVALVVAPIVWRAPETAPGVPGRR